jgi:hypothetical protein
MFSRTKKAAAKGELIVVGEDGELKRAGIFTRLFAHLIDFFTWFSLLSFFYVPGGEEEKGNRYLGITIISGKNYHFYHHLCEDVNTGPSNKFLPCGLNPQQFQKEIFYTTPNDRWLVLDPISLVKLMVKLTFKRVYAAGYENIFFIREIREKEFTVFWVHTALEPIQMKNKVADVYADELFIAGSAYYTAFGIFWKGLLRDEKVIYKILDTLERIPPSKKLLETESNLARRHRSIPAAMNAFRISDNSYESAELLYTLLLEKGTDQERRDFSRRIARNEDKDRRYKKLIFMTRKWQDLNTREK